MFFFARCGGSIVTLVYCLSQILTGTLYITGCREHHVDNTVELCVLEWGQQAPYLLSCLRVVGICSKVREFDQSVGANQPDIPSVA